VNASLSLASARARTGKHSLEIGVEEPGFDSAITGPYPVTVAGRYDATIWVSRAGPIQHVRPFLIFYGAADQILSIEQGPTFRRLSSNGWTHLTLAALAPVGAASVSIGVDDAEGTAPIYLDDVSLTGSVR